MVLMMPPRNPPTYLPDKITIIYYHTCVGLMIYYGRWHKKLRPAPPRVSIAAPVKL